jgi:hypothetical protein
VEHQVQVVQVVLQVLQDFHVLQELVVLQEHQVQAVLQVQVEHQVLQELVEHQEHLAQVVQVVLQVLQD